MSSEHQNKAAPTKDLHSPPPPTSGGETGSNNINSYVAGVYKQMKYPNPPETTKPDAETLKSSGSTLPRKRIRTRKLLREQWQYATKKMNPDAETLMRQWQYATKKYNRWYGRTWGTAVVLLYEIGWWIKGSNLLPSLRHDCTNNSPPQA